MSELQAYLHMARLDFSLEMRSNAEHMSPSGKVPFIKAGKFVIAEMDPIVSFINSKVCTRSLFGRKAYHGCQSNPSILFVHLGIIKQFLIWQGVGLTDHLDTAQKADMRAYMSLITNVLGNAEVRN